MSDMLKKKQIVEEKLYGPDKRRNMLVARLEHMITPEDKKRKNLKKKRKAKGNPDEKLANTSRDRVDEKACRR